ncbi:hypothetical protein CHS0354_038259 [Potamilus streckersoni]|uniref:Uncharacterized protein n=1 Tax=Potamilus streckersoni TaxID=2493646 RepID=A0AAE0RU53_9BIVA|nr:hypothetical protein CHS0354_038259 [Potamilus streckersoni]
MKFMEGAFSSELRRDRVYVIDIQSVTSVFRGGFLVAGVIQDAYQSELTEWYISKGCRSIVRHAMDMLSWNV